jgi:5-formyltetrahydrofolate cyclo-ligase
MAPTCESGPRGYVNADGRGGSIRYLPPVMTAETLAAEKAALRRLMRKRRAALAPEARAAASLVVRDWLVVWLTKGALAQGAAIAAYWPINDELDPRPAMSALLERGYRIALPAARAKSEPLVFRAWRPGALLEPDAMQIPAPLDAASELAPDLVLVPLLAFDAAGRRLGYGAGFYDRTLAALRSDRRVLAVGLAFSAQEVPEVPAGPEDATLDAIVTESGAGPAVSA